MQAAQTNGSTHHNLTYTERPRTWHPRARAAHASLRLREWPARRRQPGGGSRTSCLGALREPLLLLISPSRMGRCHRRMGTCSPIGQQPLQARLTIPALTPQHPDPRCRERRQQHQRPANMVLPLPMPRRVRGAVQGVQSNPRHARAAPAPLQPVGLTCASFEWSSGTCTARATGTRSMAAARLAQTLGLGPAGEGRSTRRLRVLL
jgi:hypothetical protein